MTEDEQRPFEELQRELEEIVGKLERGDVGVDEAILLWQRGEDLFRSCAAKLEEVEGRVEQLASDTRDTGIADL